MAGREERETERLREGLRETERVSAECREGERWGES